jgi:hypothetical protein
MPEGAVMIVVGTEKCEEIVESLFEVEETAWMCVESES